MDGSPVSINSTLRKNAEAAATAFQSRLSGALRLGADAFWHADEDGVIRQVLALGEEVPAEAVHLLEHKALGNLLGKFPPSGGRFRDVRAEIRPIGGSPVLMSLSGQKGEDSRWSGIARLMQQGTGLNDHQTRSVLDQLRESRDRELVLRQETETLLDGLRLLTGGRTSAEIFAGLLERLAPALEFQAAMIVQRSWAGVMSVAAATAPSLKSRDVQDLGERLLALGDVAALLDAADLAALADAERPRWSSGLAIKLRGGAKPATLLCLHESPGFFAARHLGLGIRLSLLASQAFQIEEERQSVLEASKLAAIGEMAAGIVHEINQPLTAMMLGLSNMKAALADGVYDTARAIEKLTRLEGQIQRITKIVASMKVLARRPDGAPAPFSLQEAVQDALSIIEHKLKQREIEVIADIPGALKAYGDLGECTQVVLNLLSNAHDAIEAHAAKHGARGTARISVTAAIHDADWLDVEVRDTGGGFPPAALENALLPFYTTKEAGKGTGLGLALCRRIVETMGGSIALANWEDGALIRLRLRRYPS